ncbi:sensor histidine kinase [Hymenobacter busanensis]|nr:sensor histidine kinase [Hymenobacter busanensis]QHJ07139.1 tetratricopeptide repeat protein [Hymenobacter busanensis]
MTSPDPAESLRVAQYVLRRVPAAEPAQAAAAHTRLATALLDLQRFEEASQHCRQALRSYRGREATAAYAQVLQLLGRIQFAQGDTGQARQTFLRTMQLPANRTSLAGQARLHEHLGDLYASQAAWAQALRSYAQAYAAWRRVGNARSAAVALHAIGRMHYEQRHFSQALYYLRLSTQQAQALGDSAGTSHLLLSMGDVYLAVNNDELAHGYYSRALKQLPRHHTPPQLLATVYQALAAASDSQGNSAAAQRYLLRALPLVRQGGSAVQLGELYRTLTRLYRRQGNDAAAFTVLSRYVALQDSIAAEERAVQVEELRARYEAEKKEREIVLLTKDRVIQAATLRRQALIRNGLIAGTVLLLMAVVALVRSRAGHRRINRLLERKNASINRQKQELDRLNRTKDTLFSVISHDLRSPLSSLYSLLSLLNLGKLPAERLAAHSERLTRTLETTLRLLDNLLNWAASQMQGTTVRPEPLRLDAVVEECRCLLLGDAERKHIELSNLLTEPTYARADLNMTRLVLRNLLSNAIKFTPSGGTISVGVVRQGDMWCVRVCDSGVGIASEDQFRIFGDLEPHSTLGTANEKGIGLGLRLCKDFVQRNGGRLTFESVPGQGSTFCFTLAALQPGPAAEALAAEPFRPRRRAGQWPQNAPR